MCASGTHIRGPCDDHDVISTCPVCYRRADRHPPRLPDLRHRPGGRVQRRALRPARPGADDPARELPALEGNLRDVERELGISYPTVRARVDALVRALGLGDPPTRRRHRGRPGGRPAGHPRAARPARDRRGRGRHRDPRTSEEADDHEPDLAAIEHEIGPHGSVSVRGHSKVDRTSGRRRPDVRSGAPGKRDPRRRLPDRPGPRRAPGRGGRDRRHRSPLVPDGSDPGPRAGGPARSDPPDRDRERLDPWGRLQGDQRYRTVSGDLRLTGVAGRVVIDGVSGDVAVRANARLDLEARVVSADLEATAPEFGVVRVKTTSGDLRLRGRLRRGCRPLDRDDLRGYLDRLARADRRRGPDRLRGPARRACPIARMEDPADAPSGSAREGRGWASGRSRAG